MKKFLTFIAIMVITCNLFAGGLVTNTNHSAMFTRLQNRNASTGIDAVYYNPAGVTKLGNGFFVSVNNQTVSQTKKVKTTYPYLNGSPKEYVGDVSAPVYPGVYAAYNTGNFSFSAGFNPIGGGGGAKYNDGLPSFEMPISVIPGTLAGQGISTDKYSTDIVFEGTSIYFGYQANVAYKINEQISVGAGVRIVSAKNTYNGSIKNIQINPNQPAFGAKYSGVMNPASTFFKDGSAMFSNLSTGATAMATGLTAAGLPAETPLTALSAEQQGNIAQLLGAAGLSADNVGTAIVMLNGAASGFATTAQTMTANAAATQDTYVDAEQSGTGYTPILSFNYRTPCDKFNFSLRYEFKTKLELTTTVFDNKGAGVFINGKKTVADMPAMLAIGTEFKPIDKLAVAATFNTYFDKKVDYSGGDNIEMIKRNYIEYGLGVEYSFTDKFRASAGWLGTNTGILPAYQNDQRFSSNSNGFGLGVGYRISPLIDLNIGGQYTINASYDKTYTMNITTTDPVARINPYYKETYNKETFIVAIGLDFYFGRK